MQTVQLQELAVARTDAERRLDIAQQALVEAKSGAATAGKQVELQTSQLARAERKADQDERESCLDRQNSIAASFFSLASSKRAIVRRSDPLISAANKRAGRRGSGTFRTAFACN